MANNNESEDQQMGGDAPYQSLIDRPLGDWADDFDDLIDVGSNLGLEARGSGDNLSIRVLNQQDPSQDSFTGSIGQNITMATSDPRFLPNFLAKAGNLMEGGRKVWLMAGPQGEEPKPGEKAPRPFKLGYKPAPQIEPAAPSADGGQGQAKASGKTKARTHSERVEEDDEVVEIERADFPRKQGAKQPTNKKTKGNHGQQASSYGSRNQGQVSKYKKKVMKEAGKMAEKMTEDMVTKAVVKAMNAYHGNENVDEVFDKHGKAVGYFNPASKEFSEHNPSWGHGGKGGRGGGRGRGSWQQHFGSQNQKSASSQSQPQQQQQKQQPPKWKPVREPGDNRKRLEDSIHADPMEVDTSAAVPTPEQDIPAKAAQLVIETCVFQDAETFDFE